MTDIAQEQEGVEPSDNKLATYLEQSAVDVQEFGQSSAAYRMRLASRRLRARQRAEGEPCPNPRCDSWGCENPRHRATPQREGEREPVAWRYRGPEAPRWYFSHVRPGYGPDSGVEIEPLYTEPPAERDPTRRDLFRALLGLWRTANGCPHCCNRREVEDAFNVLVRGRSAGMAEPPTERETRDDEWPNEPYERQVP